MAALKYFVIEFNHDTQSVQWTEFAAPDAAFAAVNAKESAKSAREEVVLFMAESIEMLKSTHSRYFGPPATLEIPLLELAAS
jgi:hypothetical protein